jgi:hypothetical protein
MSSIQTLSSRAQAAKLGSTRARARAWAKNKRAEPGQPMLAQARFIYTLTWEAIWLRDPLKDTLYCL